MGNFMKQYAEMMGAEVPTEKEVNMMFKLLDENEDGTISKAEIAGVLEELV